MKKHKFTSAERWAVFSVHGDVCYICRRPIDFRSMEVDHVIPERLLDEPDELAGVLGKLGRPATFDLNAYENWLPACRPCNLQKSSTPFDPAEIVLLALQRAADKAEVARANAQRTVSDKAIGNAFAALMRVANAGDLSMQELAPLFLAALDNHPEIKETMMRGLAQKNRGTAFNRMGLQVQPQVLLELRLTPHASVEYLSDGVVRLVTRGA